ncbi:hypothetical protein EV175_001317 [Coemansia sp. RSA 1933]|nr:hypothetical protein EV175_001317 [Coemansia sp. RSA 1933]
MYAGEYGRNGSGAFDGSTENDDDRLYQQQGGDNSNGADSDNIDSDVEDKILSHLYYQSNDQATSIAPTPTTQTPHTSTPAALSRRTNPGKSPHPTETGKSVRIPPGPESDTEDHESKYAIGSKRRKQENSWNLSDLANTDQNAEPAHSSGEEGELSGSSSNGQSVSVTIVPAFRTATNSDDEGTSDDNGQHSHANGTTHGDGSSHAVSYNASDDDAVNDYLDTVASSGLATPPNTTKSPATANGHSGAASHDMEHQLVQIDTLLSPGAQATGAVLHDVSAKRSLDPEDNEYDYLDEAEIQGRNRYFMEEKEIICRRCQKPGHVAKDCTTITCMVCGNEGHLSKDCKLTGSVCHRCNMRGHIAADCPQHSRGGYRDRGRPPAGCERCQIRTHHTDECPTIWRRYVYAGHRPLKYNDVRPWCYNCAQSGHFGDDCLAQRGRGANAFLGSTAFGATNCPGRCIGASNMHSGGGGGRNSSYRGSIVSGHSSSRPPRRGGKFSAGREERRRDEGRRDWRRQKDAEGNKRRSSGRPSKKKAKSNGTTTSSH